MKKLTKIVIIIVAIALLFLGSLIIADLFDFSDDNDNNSNYELVTYSFNNDNFITKKIGSDIDEDGYVYINEVKVPSDFFEEGPYFNHLYFKKINEEENYKVNVYYYKYKDKETFNLFLEKEDNFKIVKNNNNEEFYVSVINNSDFTNSVKIYYENDDDSYNTLTLTCSSCKFDDSYKLFLNKAATSKELASNYQFPANDGYFNGTLLLNAKEKETKVEISYKVPDKYSRSKSPGISFNFISFLIGEIDVNDVNSISRMGSSQLTLIEDANYILDKDIKFCADKFDVKIDTSTIKVGNNDVTYKMVNFMLDGVEQDGIFAYIKVQDDIYLTLRVLGGDQRSLDENFIKDFMNVDFKVN